MMPNESAVPPPVVGVIETALYVDDLDQSLRFYTALFGFTVAMQPNDGMAALDVAQDRARDNARPAAAQWGIRGLHAAAAGGLGVAPSKCRPSEDTKTATP